MRTKTSNKRLVDFIKRSEVHENNNFLNKFMNWNKNNNNKGNVRNYVCVGACIMAFTLTKKYSNGYKCVYSLLLVPFWRKGERSNT